METKINPDDIVSLSALVHASGIDMMATPLRLAADGTLTVPDAIAEKVGAILRQPDWPTRGHKRMLADHADVVRVRKEAAGIIVDGNAIATDPARRTLLLVLTLAAGREIKLKTADGKWMRLDAEHLATVQAAINDHLQRCYELQEKIETQIEYGQITTTEQVDAAFDELD